MIILALGVGLIALWFYQRPKPDGLNLTVQFIGMTNDVSGSKSAIFILHNTGNVHVEVADPMIELRGKGPAVSGGGYFFRHRLSPSSPPLTVQVGAPRAREQWRAVFHYIPLRLRDRLMKNRLVMSLFTRFGIRTSRVVTLSNAYSEWMEPTLPETPGFSTRSMNQGRQGEASR